MTSALHPDKAPDESNDDKPKRIQVLLDREAQQKLSELQELYGFTVADTIRESVGFFYWAHKQFQENYDFGLVMKGKLESVIQLPFAWRGRR